MVYVRETMALISKNGSCGTPTDYPFWKDVEDVYNNVRTRNELKRRTSALLTYTLNIKVCQEITQSRLIQNDFPCSKLPFYTA